MKNIRYFFEYVFLLILFKFFALMPAKTASNIGGIIGKIIGPYLAASRKASRNISMAFPELSHEERQKILIGMWENLGRVIAEYPHLEKLGRDCTFIENGNKFKNIIAQRKGAICFGGHIGNWEINSVSCLTQLEIAVDISYRAPNNPWTDRLLNKTRSIHGTLASYSKSRSGGKNMIEAIKNGRVLGILIDQKYNEGLDVPFFGMSAMTNPFFVQLAQKYKCPLIPIRNIRLDGTHFKLEIFEPIALFKEDGTLRPIADIVLEAHHLLEGWIRDKPEQWLWLHRRWKDHSV